MRRAGHLFVIVQVLRLARLMTAQDMGASTAALPLHVIAPITDRLNNPALAMVSQLKDALQARVCVILDYPDANGIATLREVLHAALSLLGDAWTLGGWCHLRQDNRMFCVAILDMPTGAGFSPPAPVKFPPRSRRSAKNTVSRVRNIPSIRCGR